MPGRTTPIGGHFERAKPADTNKKMDFAFMLLTARRLRLCARIFTAFLLVFIIFAGTAIYFLQRNPEALTQHFLDELSRNTGLNFSVESVNVVFFPLPSVAVSNPEIEGPNLHISAAYATLRPDFMALLRGVFRPADISLLRPRVRGTLMHSLADLTALVTPANLDASASETSASASETNASASANTVDASPSTPSSNAPNSGPNNGPSNALASGLTLPLPAGCRLSIVQGELTIETADKARLHLDGVQCNLKVRSSGSVSGDMHWVSAQLLRTEALVPAAALDNFHFKGRIDPAQLLSASDLTLSGVLRLPGLLDRLTFKTQFSGDASTWTAYASLYGDIIKDGEFLPFALDGTAHAGTDKVISLQQLRLELGEDSGLLNASLRLDGNTAGHSVAPEALAPTSSARTLAAGADAAAKTSTTTGPPKPRGPVLEGRLQLHRFSLTRWLGFARNLTPGLQLTLDNVTDGMLLFSLDQEGLNVPHIRARAAGSLFTGLGSVPQWTKPEVILDLKATHINVGLAVPEAVSKPPLPVYFSHGTFTPMPTEPPKPGDIGVDYDIRLAGEKVSYGPLRLENVQVVIRPGKKDKNGHEDSQLTADARLYGGSMRGEAILGSGPEATYDLKLRLRDVNAGPTARDLTVLPLVEGRVRADAEVVSKGRDTTTFLANLRGNATIRAEQGALRLSNDPDAEPVTFQMLDVSLKARNASLRKTALGLDGQWQGTLARTGLDAQASLNGMLWFGGQGDNSSVDFQNLPGSLTAKIAPEISGLLEGLQADIRGNFSSRGSDGRILATDTTIQALGMDAQGRLQVNLGGQSGLSWQGNLNARIPDFSRTLGYMTRSNTSLPPPLRSLELSAAFKGNPEELTLNELRIQLDKSTVSGSLNVNRRKQLSLDFTLAANTLDLDKWFPRAPSSPAAKAKKKSNDRGADNRPGVSMRGSPTPKAEAVPKPQASKAASKPWDLRPLREIRVKGELRVAQLTGWKLNAQSLIIPVLMENGRLTLAPITGRLYGAALHSRSRFEFTRGLSLESSLSVDGFDLAAAATDKGGAALSGRADVSSEITATLTGSGQLLAALNGRWKFLVRNGSYQARTDNGALKGKPTNFQQTGASGLIAAGVVRSDDFTLLSPDLKVNGGGWVDLNNETLDCNFNVNMKGLPDFPLRLHGSLSDSKTSIGAGKLILNTLGGITFGLFDVLGGVVEGTWRIFR